jgi:hypothetical protein
MRAVALRPYALAGLCGRAPMTVAGNRRTGFGKSTCDCGTQATGRARDECDFTAQGEEIQYAHRESIFAFQRRSLVGTKPPT